MSKPTEKENDRIAGLIAQETYHLIQEMHGDPDQALNMIADMSVKAIKDDFVGFNGTHAIRANWLGIAAIKHAAHIAFIDPPEGMPREELDTFFDTVLTSVMFVMHDASFRDASESKVEPIMTYEEAYAKIGQLRDIRSGNDDVFDNFISSLCKGDAGVIQ